MRLISSSSTSISSSRFSALPLGAASALRSFSGWHGGIGIAFGTPSRDIADVTEMGYEIVWGSEDPRAIKALGVSVFRYWNSIVETSLKGPGYDFSGMVDKDEAAIILPIDGDRVWLVSQFRYTIQQRALELPQGGWEQAVVDPEELARGELREETGLNAAHMVFLGTLWIAYGFARQKQHVFLATGLTQSTTDRDDEEHDLQVRSFSIDEFEEMMLCGQIRDNCTLAAWALYLMKKARQA